VPGTRKSSRIVPLARREFLRAQGFLAYAARGVGLLTIGPLFASGPARRLRDAIDLRPGEQKLQLRLAVVAHVYYLDLVDEILECFAKLGPAALFVTTEPSKFDALAARLKDVPGARVIAHVNRGRDIAPFLSLLNAGELDAFDAVLKLHTKKSPHLMTGDVRRRLLYIALAGSRRRVRDVARAFADPSTGLVGWRPSWRTEQALWLMNRARVNALLARMGVTPSSRPAFFEGSMFWVRPSALARLAALDLKPEDFEPEGPETDGLLHHAIERLFAPVVAAEGYIVRDLGGRVLPPGRHRGE